MKEEVTDKEQLLAIANQLKCPTGNNGITIGHQLHEKNISMTESSIESLLLEDRNRVLEIGPGVCYHLPSLLNRAAELRYFGMEISETMIEQAENFNIKYIKKRKALFQLYNGSDIDYVTNFFHRILSVNTIYFIDNPIYFFKEMYRLLMPGGYFVLTFANSDFMEKLPFVNSNDVFKLYDAESIRELVAKTNFKIEYIKKQTEEVISKSGEKVKRSYSILLLSKAVKKTFTY